LTRENSHMYRARN